MKVLPRLLAVCLVAAPLFGNPLHARQSKAPALSDEEEDKIRAAQEPSERIMVYADLIQKRLDLFSEWRNKSDEKYDIASYLKGLLGECDGLVYELKNVIEENYDRGIDMRRGLRKLIERGGPWLAELRGAGRSPDAYATAYEPFLDSAAENVEDLLEGATKALAEQEKQFFEAAEKEAAEKREAKKASKEDKKREKEDKKLRKKQGKRGVPGEIDDN